MSNELSNVQFSGELNIEDVLSVVTSRAERSFNEKFAAAKTQVTGLEKAIKAKQAEIKACTDKECLALVTEKAEAARASIEALGGTITTTANGVTNDGKLKAQIVIKRGEGGYNGIVDFTFNGTKSEALVAMEQEHEELRNKLQDATNEAMNWKKKLQGIPALERATKAKIAEAKLAQTADGQALLEVMTKNLEAEMLALPGF